MSSTLRRCGLFRGLNDPALDELALQVLEERHPGGALLIREGDVADAMFVVLEGAAQVFTTDREGKTVVLARLEAGDHFGEQALLPGSTGRRGASVRALLDVRLGRISRDAFVSVLSQDDALHGRLVTLGRDQAAEALSRMSSLARALDLGSVAPGRRILEDGDVLFHQGDDADALYLVRSGCLTVWRTDEQGRSLIAKVEQGGCVGELGLVRREPRQATVVSEGTTEVLRVEREPFDAAYRRSPELREHLTTLERLYDLPGRGVATQRVGQLYTTIYLLHDGRQFSAHRSVGEEIYVVERMGVDAPAEVLSWTDPENSRTRELHLTGDGTIIGLSAFGRFKDAAEHHLFVLDGRGLDASERALFLDTGSLAVRPIPIDAPICSCVGVTDVRILDAIKHGATTFDALQRITGCGTVCGGCAPAVIELLGEDAWVTADVEEVRDEAPGIRSFFLAPRDPDYPQPNPGQHVVVEAKIGGAPVRRPYTVSSAPGASRLRITVKREGLLSGWLFDQGPRALRLSHPRGDFVVDLDRPSAVCLVAGIGVTPALAAVGAASGATRLLVHYSGRTREHMACLSELEDSAGNGVELIVRETAREGRIGPSEVADLVARNRGADFYLCGPTRYLDEVSVHLRRAGVEDDRIFVEAFTPSGAPAPRAEEVEQIERFLLMPPEAPPPRRGMRALKRAGRALSTLANHPLVNPKIRGQSFTPLGMAEQWIARRLAAADPAVPLEHLGPVGALAMGPHGHPQRVFERLAPLREKNRARALEAKRMGRTLAADTPDGDSFVYVSPAPPLVPLPDEVRIETSVSQVPGRSWFPIYIVRGRTATDHVLRTGPMERCGVPYYYLAQILGRGDLRACPGRDSVGLFAGPLHDNATWTEDRTFGLEMFGLSTIDALGPTMSSVIDELSRTLAEAVSKSPGPYDINVMMSKIAYTVVVQSVFGKVDLARFHELGQRLSTNLRSLLDNVYEFNMGRQSVPERWVERLQELASVNRSMVDTIRELHHQGRLSATQYAVPSVRLALDLESAPDGGYRRLWTLFAPLLFGGHETTAHTMSWAFYEIARSGELEARILGEIEAFKRAHGGSAVRPQDYDERPLAFALLAECLRRYPPFTAIPRTAMCDGVVPPDPATGIGGFRYPKGSMLIVSFSSIGRDPARWPAPSEFDIDRHLHEIPAGATTIERGRAVRRNIRAKEEALDLMAFSEGPARCPGLHFNAHEFLLVLDALLPRFCFELVEPHRKVEQADAPIAGPEPGALAMRIRPR